MGFLDWVRGFKRTAKAQTFSVTMTELTNATQCGPRDDANAFRALSEKRHFFQRNASGNVAEFEGHRFEGIVDDELRHLKGFPELTKVNIDGVVSVPGKPCITDAGLAHLANLTQLEELTVGYTRVTDVGLTYLRQLSSLKYLSLRSTNVTDEGLEILVNLKSLRTLALRETRVTPCGVQKLQAALPACKIDVKF